MATDRLSESPWLLLPGTLCTAAVFDDFLDVLGVGTAQRHALSLNSPCIRDYGAAFADIPADTVVCGFSLGAIVAAHHANQMTAGKLMLFGLNPYPDDPSKAAGRHDLAADVIANGGAAALKARALAVHGPDTAKTREAIYQMANETTPLIDAQTRLALTRPGALPALAQARMPVLSLTGSHDQNASTAQGLAAAEAAPHGRFICLEGLGHYALLEDPAACAKAALQMTE